MKPVNKWWLSFTLLVIYCLLFGRRFEAIATNTQLDQQSTSGSSTSLSSSNNQTPAKPSSQNNGILYSCEWSYLQLDSAFVNFSINHLSLIDRNNATDVQEIEDSFTDGYGSIEARNFALREISLSVTHDELKANKLDANLPFVFFINGFNTFNQEGEVNGTWMFDVAKMYARRGLQNRHRRPNEPELDANVIFLTWGIPHIFAESMLAMIPAYYKTLANYDVVLEFVSETIIKIIDYVEEFHTDWKSELERQEYYSKFQFFGHSLGSHIITDAVNRVRKASNRSGKKPIKFGKLMGLDPALPCFLSLTHAEKLANSTVELVVLHSNAGLAGLTSERSNVEIVLNGGTFQPGCAWYEFSCHHSRSTAIFGYTDDRCQMVAYKCSSYGHFKNGACETCDFDPSYEHRKSAVNGFNSSTNHMMNSSKTINSKNNKQRQSDTYGKNCVLVNLPEQHSDTKEVIEFVKQMDDKSLRQLADEDDELLVYAGDTNEALQMSELFMGQLMEKNLNSRSATVDELTNPMVSLSAANKQGSSTAHRRVYYHFVNTSPNYRSGRKTHCLQHYQVRLIVLSDNLAAAQKCPLSSFIKGNNGIGGRTGSASGSNSGLKIRLFHDDETLNQQAGGIGWWTNRMDETRRRKRQARTLRSSPNIELNTIFQDNLYTSLLNFEGSPELFIAAELNNINLKQYHDCLTSVNSSSSSSTGRRPQGETNFVLDVAFMSHTKTKFRHAFSSILCGNISQQIDQQLNQNDDSTNNLVLKLCKRSELANVSDQIDKMLDHIEQERLVDSWQVSLLNSLFSLFAEWEPF